MGRFVTKALLVLNIVVVLALIVIKISTYISPNRVMLLAYPSLVLFPVVLLNILFLCYWIFKRKWRFILSLGVLIFCFDVVQTVYSIPLFQKEPSLSEGKYTKLTLLSYNMMNVLSEQKYTSQQTNPVMDYLSTADADIVCLQEFGYDSREKFFGITDIKQFFSHYPYQHLSLRKKKWGIKLGIATFSKYPIITMQQVDYPVEVNQSIYSDIVVGKDTIRVVNNHLESNKITQKNIDETYQLKKDPDSEKIGTLTKILTQKLKVAYQVRAQQADAVAKVIAESPYKIIACGDFNDVPSSYTYTKIRGKMKDAFVQKGKGRGITFAKSLYRFRIDYILYDPAIQTNNFKVGTLEASDHFPIQATLYLKKKDEKE